MHNEPDGIARISVSDNLRRRLDEIATLLGISRENLATPEDNGRHPLAGDRAGTPWDAKRLLDAFHAIGDAALRREVILIAEVCGRLDASAKR